MPGVNDVGIASSVPISGSFPNGTIGIDGGDSPTALGIYQVVSGGYFTSLNIPLLQGRLFDDRDNSTVADVAIVSESFAELAWPGQNPLGKRITGGGMDSYLDPDVPEDAEYYLRNRWATVVGVVSDLRQESLTDIPEPTYYFHYQQRPARARYGAVVAKTGVPATSVLTELRTISNNLDPMVPVSFRLMDSDLGDSVANRRFTLTIMGAFAGLALLLSALGIYGVVSYFVARRTREMGIRLALGAEPGRVRALVQRGAMGTVLLGILAGVAGSIAVMRLMESLLYEVSPYDPMTLTGVVALLMGAAWLASYLPARRTSRIDPIVTMRAE
jgi:predicted permease